MSKQADRRYMKSAIFVPLLNQTIVYAPPSA